VTEYDETKPLQELVQMKRNLADLQEHFVDADGHPLDLGYPVQYIAQREDLDDDEVFGTVWNNERWGIIVGFTATLKWDYENSRESDEMDYSVKVAHPHVVTSRTGEGSSSIRDEFSCAPDSLRVIQ
jgi:hypothetical protein